jgi:cytochrome c5
MLRKTLPLLIVFILIGIVLATACSEANVNTTPVDAQKTQISAEQVSVEGKALLEERCVSCHDLSRVENEKKTVDGWKSTVERMVKKGAQLSSSEQEILIKYLSEMYKK